MNIKLVFLLFSLLFSISLSGQINEKSAYNDLVDRMRELKSISKTRQQKIDKLEGDITVLLNDNRRTNAENDRLNKAIENKTTEIYILKSQLGEMQFEYDKLLYEFNNIARKTALQETYILELEQDKATLESDLAATNLQVESLAELLRNNELALAEERSKNAALTKRIKELLDRQQTLTFLEVSSNMPFGFHLDLIHGRLLKGKNLFVGGSLGYAIYQYDNTLPENDINLSMVHVSGVLRVPVSRRKKLGFSHVYPEETLSERSIYFVSIEPGVSIATNSNQDQIGYNQGGFNIAVSFGAILNINDSANLYAVIGLRTQSLRAKYDMRNDRRSFTGFHLGIGFNF